jgi:hypothetical protein
MVYFQKAGICSCGLRIPLNSSPRIMKKGISVAATKESALKIVR